MASEELESICKNCKNCVTIELGTKIDEPQPFKVTTANPFCFTYWIVDKCNAFLCLMSGTFNDDVVECELFEMKED